MQPDIASREVVMSYIGALDGQDYEAAGKLLNHQITIRGPGETYTRPEQLLEILKKHRSKYDVHKVFVDGNDVCVLYDLVTPTVRAFTCSLVPRRGREDRFDPYDIRS